MPDPTGPTRADLVIDPDCRDGKCGSCVGGPCEHWCHSHGATAERAIDSRGELLGRVADAILAVTYPVEEWPDGPPGEGEMDFAREQAAAALAVIDGDQGEHVIELRDDGWTIKHPLSCRPTLFDCPVNKAAAEDLAGPPAEPGRFVCGLDAEGHLLIGRRVEEAGRG